MSSKKESKISWIEACFHDMHHLENAELYPENQHWMKGMSVVRPGVKSCKSVLLKKAAFYPDSAVENIKHDWTLPRLLMKCVCQMCSKPFGKLVFFATNRKREKQLFFLRQDTSLTLKDKGKMPQIKGSKLRWGMSPSTWEGLRKEKLGFNIRSIDAEMLCVLINKQRHELPDYAALSRDRSSTVCL